MYIIYYISTLWILKNCMGMRNPISWYGILPSLGSLNMSQLLWKLEGGKNERVIWQASTILPLYNMIHYTKTVSYMLQTGWLKHPRCMDYTWRKYCNSCQAEWRRCIQIYWSRYIVNLPISYIHVMPVIWLDSPIWFMWLTQGWPSRVLNSQGSSKMNPEPRKDMLQKHRKRTGNKRPNKQPKDLQELVIEGLLSKKCLKIPGWWKMLIPRNLWV